MPKKRREDQTRLDQNTKSGKKVRKVRKARKKKLKSPGRQRKKNQKELPKKMRSSENKETFMKIINVQRKGKQKAKICNR